MDLDELLAEYGDVEPAMGDATTTLRGVLEPLGDDEYDSAEEDDGSSTNESLEALGTFFAVAPDSTPVVPEPRAGVGAGTERRTVREPRAPRRFGFFFPA